jgi:hypothetical protein
MRSFEAESVFFQGLYAKSSPDVILRSGVRKNLVFKGNFKKNEILTALAFSASVAPEGRSE